MFHHLDFPRLFLCESTGYSKHKTTGIASVAICGGSNHILTGLYVKCVQMKSIINFTHFKKLFTFKEQQHHIAVIKHNNIIV